MDNRETTMIVEQPRPSALAKMANRIEVDPDKLLSTLKNTVFKGASNDELLALVITANEYDLNPLLKEFYAFPAKGGGIVPMVSVDGWMKIINRQPNYDGMEVTVANDGSTATCKIYLKDRSHPVTITEYLDECKRPTEPWKTMPKRMLRHKAIIQAGRVAFGIGGIHDEDEARDAGMRNVEGKVVEFDAEVDPIAEAKKPVEKEVVEKVEIDAPSKTSEENLNELPDLM